MRDDRGQRVRWSRRHRQNFGPICLIFGLLLIFPGSFIGHYIFGEMSGGFFFVLFGLLHVLLAFMPFSQPVGSFSYSDPTKCMSCGYGLRDLSPEPDGCIVCPECGAAWKLPSRDG
ncbi:MAG: hypothetical protein AAGB48_03840 [Planctomycetota bacterium]